LAFIVAGIAERAGAEVSHGRGAALAFAPAAAADRAVAAISGPGALGAELAATRGCPLAADPTQQRGESAPGRERQDTTARTRRAGPIPDEIVK
jgi:hypothetical protein